MSWIYFEQFVRQALCSALADVGSSCEQEFLEPLVEADPPIISPDNQSTFFSEVLGNLFDVRETAQSFSDALLNRQREHTDLIQNIGDVVLNIALDWGSQYKSYASHYPFAKASIQQEKQRNPSFELFVNVSHSLVSLVLQTDSSYRHFREDRQQASEISMTICKILPSACLDIC